LLSPEAVVEARATALGVSAEEYRRQRAADRGAALRAKHEAEAAQRAAETAAAAAAAGQTVEEYQEEMRRVLAQADEARGCFFGGILFSIPASLVVGAVLVAASLLLGGPPLAVLGGAVVGLGVGSSLGFALYVVMPSGRSSRVDDTVLLLAWALPPVTVAVCALAAAALAG
jgi:hypothetical protein